uniref:HsdR family type I site-specific deoxyribonuclease n=1 Tax=Methanobrevibacter gottschalkii TaxID=190974 RepID=UPI0026EA3585
MKSSSMSSQSEAVLENNLIKRLSENGYERVKIRNESELLSNFRTQLDKLNKCQLTDEEFEKVVLFLEQGSIFDKAKKLRDHFFIERENDSFYIKFLNQKDWCKNIFQVTNQITVKGKHENRYDVTLLINGLPLVQIELKRRGMPLKEAFDQITRYATHSYKGLFNYIQIFVVSNGVNTKYFANGLKQDLQYEFTFYWKDENNNNILSLDDFADTFLEKCNLAKMISKYIVLNESSKRLMVLRAYQKYAVEAVIHQALDIKKNGYIWHTTGSGKTLTSYKVSQLLAEDESIYKVIFVVDRRDLDLQTNKEFNSFCDGCVNTTKHTGALIKNLTTDGRGKLVTTTIQKLSKAVKTAGDKTKLQNIKDKNIILIFDECHRSQFGEMHNVITEFFTNSLSFGFTGTPIFAKNSDGTRTTKNIFGKKLH